MEVATGGRCWEWEGDRRGRSSHGFRRDPRPRAALEIITAHRKSISKLLLGAGGTVAMRNSKTRRFARRVQSTREIKIAHLKQLEGN